ncbi:CsbD family protein [Enterococcus mediterraneensis]|uniref:CsbD family protein n=1 Tax=Enterococcus mediterraneensis TaxID=2364791 RepID=UPI000F07271F|nr:CsbD family protein [Enterococcus mediterraneensis]
MSNLKDKIVGSAKKKIGDLTNNEELSQEGKVQKEDAELHSEQRKKRIEELEDMHEEKKAQTQDATKEHVGRDLEKSDKLAEDGLNEERIEEERMKHYTGIEEKL